MLCVWKNIIGSKASTIGKYNPFRYKGYYYDEKSKMYYCKSRYYVPEWCRWLNVYSGFRNGNKIIINDYKYVLDEKIQIIKETYSKIGVNIEKASWFG